MNLADELLSPTHLARVGDLPAVMGSGGTLTYRELAVLVDGCAHALASRGLARRVVLLAMQDSPVLIAAFLGAVKMGAIPVFVSPRLPPADMASIAADADAALMVHDADAPLGLQIPRLAGNALAAEAAGRGAFPAVPFTIADEAFRVYSSGTTGRPKGIVHGHKSPAPCGAYLRDHLGIGPGSRVFCTSKLSFAYAQGNGFLGPLALGATVVLEPEWPSPRWAVEMVVRHRPDVVFSTPSLYRGILAEADGDALAALRRVSHFVSAGEALPDGLARQWRESTGRPILNAYGCAEVIALVLAQPPDAAVEGTTGIPIGKGELRLAPIDGGPDVGQLWLRHPFLANGYHGLAHMTRQRFVDGWFATGDVFSRDAAGRYSHRGRQDGFIKVAGQWVQLSEIETTALASGAAADAAAVAVKDAQGFARVALFVIPRPPLAEGEAVRRVRAHFEASAPRHRWPRWVHALVELPRTATGKVQLRRLQELAGQEDRPE
jgi:acyl-coenzyme A synthetase/AMP-(fatty) acid ligase